jgi:type II pantothenate kinase
LPSILILFLLCTGHAATISTLSYAIRFWSKGTKRALFLRHEGYLGGIGAWLKNIGAVDAAAAGGAGGAGAAPGERGRPAGERRASEQM